jgi:hypothetical protein
VTGGVGIGGNLNVASSGVVKISNTTSSNASNNGALVVTGGVGIGGNLNVGGMGYVAGRLGVATTTPEYDLDVKGTLNTSSIKPSSFSQVASGTIATGTYGILGQSVVHDGTNFYYMKGANTSYTPFASIAKFSSSAVTSWTTLTPDTGFATNWQSAEYVNSRIYCFGGWSSWSGAVLSTVRVYNTTGGTWSTGTPMLKGLAGPLTAVYDNRYVFVLGGRTNAQNGSVNESQTLYICDTNTGSWSTVTINNYTTVFTNTTSGAAGRFNNSMVIHNNTLYVIGNLGIMYKLEELGAVVASPTTARGFVECAAIGSTQYHRLFVYQNNNYGNKH